MINFRRDVYCMLGLPFDAVDMTGAVRRVQDAAERRTPCFLSTPNVNFLIGCRADSRFRDSVINSDLSVADGMPLVWIARLLGIPIPQRVAGSCLYERLKTHDTSAPLSVYFFGGGEGVAAAAYRRLNAEKAGLVSVGFAYPGRGSVEELSRDESIEKINASGADILIVSLGAKRGQAWIERNRRRLNVPVISHLGAVVNFAAGTLNRAPVWMRDCGLEWLWRMKEERYLWRRYFQDGLGLLSLVLTRALPYAWYLKRHKTDADRPGTIVTEAGNESPHSVIRLHGAWTRWNLETLRDSFSKVAMAGKDVRLELDGVTYIDSAFVGLIMLLSGYQAQRGRQLLIGSASKPVRKIFRFCCADYLFSAPTAAPAPAQEIQPVRLPDSSPARLAA